MGRNCDRQIDIAWCDWYESEGSLRTFRNKFLKTGCEFYRKM